MKQNTLLRISDLKINWEKLKLVDWKYSPQPMSDYFSRTVLKLAGKGDAGCHCCLTVFCGHSYLGRGRGADDHSIQLGIWFKKRQGSKFAFVTLRAREHSHTKKGQFGGALVTWQLPDSKLFHWFCFESQSRFEVNVPFCRVVLWHKQGVVVLKRLIFLLNIWVFNGRL